MWHFVTTLESTMGPSTWYNTYEAHRPKARMSYSLNSVQGISKGIYIYIYMNMYIYIGE